MRIKLTSAMEQEDLSSEAASENVELAADSTETSLINEENERRSIDELNETIDDSVDDADQLEQVRERLEATVDEGGVSPETIDMARVAVESVYRRLGIDNVNIPSTENFKSNARRVANTKLAIEGISDTIKRIWESIVKAIKSLWEKVKDWWDSYFDGINKLIKKAEAVEKKLEGMTQGMEVIRDEKGKSFFDAPGFVKTVGKIALQKDLTFGIHDDISKSFNEDQIDTLKKRINSLMSVTSYMSHYVKEIKDLSSFSTVEPLTGKVLQKIGYREIPAGIDGYLCYTTSHLAGFFIIIMVPKSEFGRMSMSYFESIAMMLPVAQLEGKEPQYFSNEIQPCALEKLLEMKNGSILTKLAKALEQMKTANKEATKAMDDLVEKVGKSIASSSDKDKENIEKARKSVMRFSSFGSKFNTVSLSLLKRYVNIVVNYAELSIPRYTKNPEQVYNPIAISK